VPPVDEWDVAGDLDATAVVQQSGPSCGLAALLTAASMLRAADVEVDILRAVAACRDAGISRQGELFSASSLAAAAAVVTPHLACVPRTFPVWDQLAAEMRERRTLWLVPYDTDRNHAPACQRGHKAHWALVVGACARICISVRCSRTHMYTGTACVPGVGTAGRFVWAVHGKSKRLQLWSFEALAASNGQLFEIDPERMAEGAGAYVFDAGQGLDGLRSHAVSVTHA
jgi:hypothetical protein